MRESSAAVVSSRSIGEAPRIRGVDVVLPEHRYAQAELLQMLAFLWRDRPRVVHRLEQLFRSVRVESRSLALPLEEYAKLGGFGDANNAFIREGTKLGARAIRAACAGAGVALEDIDAIFFTTVTGLATPTIDARLVNVLGLRDDVRRVPMFGLGCVGGAAGLARASEWLRGQPDAVAVLLAVELCSLTLQDDVSVPSLIASGLFGDGAAAVVLTGADRDPRSSRRLTNVTSLKASRGPRIVATRSVFFRNTEHVMGWDIGETGFKVVLSADVPTIARTHLAGAIDRFLAEHRLGREAVAQWICHPGGPKIIEAIEDALGLRAGGLDLTRRSLADVGNLSSASVLHVLAETNRRARSGDIGVLLAMGPGFCAELVLLQW
jgi:alkylresorcinol/alkylpyrone synthase